MIILSNLESIKKRNEVDFEHVITIGPLSLHNNYLQCGLIYGNDPKLDKLFSTNTILNECTFEAISNEYNSHAIWFELKKNDKKFPYEDNYIYKITDTNNSVAYKTSFNNFNEKYKYVHFVLSNHDSKLYIVSSNSQEFNYPLSFNPWLPNNNFVATTKEWSVSYQKQCYYSQASYILYNIEQDTKCVIGLRGNKNELLNQTLKHKIYYTFPSKTRDLKQTTLDFENEMQHPKLKSKRNNYFVRCYSRLFCSWGCML